MGVNDNELLPKNMRGEFFFGFAHPNVAKFLESLPNVDHLKNYQKRYDRKIRISRRTFLRALSPVEGERILDLPENESGCARTEPYRKITRGDKFAYMDAFGLNPCNAYLTGVSESIQKEKRFHISIDEKSRSKKKRQRSLLSMYHSMREKNKNQRLQVLRSRIQGWGVFAKQLIPKGEMVIEYVGEIIHSALADMREAYYNSCNIGCYMFRLPEDEYIIDATMKGNMARFINHSCNPNAKTDWIVINNKKKIVICAIRDIYPGEEISYDYMMYADEGDTVECHCGAPNCKGYMNV
jgi:hypothetical protein